MEFVINELEEYGYRACFVNLECLDLITGNFYELLQSGKISESLSRRYLSNFNFDLLDEMHDIKSVLVIAAPKPQVEVKFRYKNKTFAITIPPTYTGYNNTPLKILEDLTKKFSEHGYRFLKTNIPEKLLAANSGLVYYGRNNISYIPGLGSFYQLFSFVTNIKADNADPQDFMMLERCFSCVACVKVCPTQAITTDRFLIHAEKCLTFLNENPGVFPDWVNPNAHNSLVGCILCQKYCPENKKFVNWIESSVSFNEKETNMILQSDNMKNFSEILLEKIRRLDLVGTHIEFNVLKRNLKVLLDKGLNSE